MRAAAAATLTLSVASDADGRLPLRIVLDAAADALGNPVSLGQTTTSGAVAFGGSTETFAAPADARRPSRDAPARRNSGPRPRRAHRGHRPRRRARRNGRPSTPTTTRAWATRYGADANGDGCVEHPRPPGCPRHQSWTVANGVAVSPAQSTQSNGGSDSSRTNSNAVAAGQTFVVTSTTDAARRQRGRRHLCRLTRPLHAARCHHRGELGARPEHDRLQRLGHAPVTIQLSSSLPQVLVQDRTGGTLIDGYSQPGSRVNTSTYGSNAIPGVYISEPGATPGRTDFASPARTTPIRGLIVSNNDRGDRHRRRGRAWQRHRRRLAQLQPRRLAELASRAIYNLWIANGANHNQSARRRWPIAT